MVNEKKKCIENVNKMVEAEVTTRSSSTQAYTSVTKVVIYDRRILILRRLATCSNLNEYYMNML